MKAQIRKRPLQPLFAILITSLISGCFTTRSSMKKEGVDGDDPVGATQTVEMTPVEAKSGYVVDELKSEITRLTGRIEDMERSKGTEAERAQTEKAKQEQIDKLEQRIVELENAQLELIEQFKKYQGVAEERGAEKAGELIDQARTKAAGGDHEGALDILTRYLATPKAPRAEEATFLRAESFYETKQYRKAIADYGQFTEKYTKSKLMPTVLYKIGLSFRAINAREDASVFLQELIDKHPKSPEAKKAKSILAQMR
jgi:TolA-binding protein